MILIKKNMKKIFTLLSLMTLVIVSCEEPSPEVFSGEPIAYYLDGDSGTFTITSEEDAYTITVGTTNTTPQDRVFSVEIDESSTATSDQYNISENLVIPGNSHFGTITVTGNIANVVPGSQVIINLKEVQSTAVAGFQNSFTLDLYLYCAFDRDSYIGDYVADEEGYGEYDVSLSAGSAPNELIISNLWDYTPASQTRIFITEPSVNEFIVSGTEDYLDNPLLLFTQGQSYVGDISGTTNSCTKFLDFVFNVYLPDIGYSSGLTGITLTKK